MIREESFSVLWQGYDTDKAALAARNARARELRASGARCHCWTLPNQLRQYAGFGQPDGSSCNVYKISVESAA